MNTIYSRYPFKSTIIFHGKNMSLNINNLLRESTVGIKIKMKFFYYLVD